MVAEVFLEERLNQQSAGLGAMVVLAVAALLETLPDVLNRLLSEHIGKVELHLGDVRIQGDGLFEMERRADGLVGGGQRQGHPHPGHRVAGIGDGGQLISTCRVVVASLAQVFLSALHILVEQIAAGPGEGVHLEPLRLVELHPRALLGLLDGGSHPLQLRLAACLGQPSHHFQEHVLVPLEIVSRGALLERAWPFLAAACLGVRVVQQRVRPTAGLLDAIVGGNGSARERIDLRVALVLFVGEHRQPRELPGQLLAIARTQYREQCACTGLGHLPAEQIATTFVPAAAGRLGTRSPVGGEFLPVGGREQLALVAGHQRVSIAGGGVETFAGVGVQQAAFLLEQVTGLGPSLNFARTQRGARRLAVNVRSKRPAAQNVVDAHRLATEAAQRGGGGNVEIQRVGGAVFHLAAEIGQAAHLAGDVTISPCQLGVHAPVAADHGVVSAASDLRIGVERLSRVALTDLGMETRRHGEDGQQREPPGR